MQDWLQTLKESFNEYFPRYVSPLRQGSIYQLEVGESSFYDFKLPYHNVVYIKGKGNYIINDDFTRIHIPTFPIYVNLNFKFNYTNDYTNRHRQINTFILTLIEKFIEKEKEFLNENFVVTSKDAVGRVKKFFENLNRSVYVYSQEIFENMLSKVHLIVRTEPTITFFSSAVNCVHISLWEDVGFFISEKRN